MQPSNSDTHAGKRVPEAPAARRAEEPSEFCPRCSSKLAARSCKMICAHCGYYMSCSDFY